MQRGTHRITRRPARQPTPPQRARDAALRIAARRCALRALHAALPQRRGCVPTTAPSSPWQPSSRQQRSIDRRQALVLTFISYALFHATRKPPSVVKRCAPAERESSMRHAAAAAAAAARRVQRSWQRAWPRQPPKGVAGAGPAAAQHVHGRGSRRAHTTTTRHTPTHLSSPHTHTTTTATTTASSKATSSRP